VGESGESSDYGAESPPVIIGGPTGDYKILADIPSALWTEYRVLQVAFSGAGSTVVSGHDKPIGLDYTGGTTLNDGNHAYGEAYAAGGSGSQAVSGGWRRVVNSQQRVFVRIDTVGAIFVTLQFRPRLVTDIPGPWATGHPDNMQATNEARADAIRQRLGIEKEIEEFEEETITTKRMRRMRTNAGRK
jgi:hypothetical protein